MTVGLGELVLMIMRNVSTAASLGLVALLAATSRAQSPVRWSLVAGAGPTIDGTYNVQGAWAARFEGEQTIGARSYAALNASSPGSFFGVCSEDTFAFAGRLRDSCFTHFPAVVTASAGVASPWTPGPVALRAQLGGAIGMYWEVDHARADVGVRTGRTLGAEGGLEMSFGSAERAATILTCHPMALISPDHRAMWVIPIAIGRRF